MQVLREECWNGGDRYSVRFTIKSGLFAGKRIVVGYDANGWTRQHATQALDLIQDLTGCHRNSIKYV